MSITGLKTDFILKYNDAWQLIATSHILIEGDDEIGIAKAIIQGNIPEKYIATHALITEFDEQEFGVVMYGLKANFLALLQK